MRRKISKKQRLKKKLDRLVQIKYQEKYPECLVCGKPTDAMHHFIQKSQSLFLRWKLINLIPLCNICHFKHHSIGSRPGDPAIHAEILRVKGFEWYDEITRLRRTFWKDTIGNLEEMEASLL